MEYLVPKDNYLVTQKIRDPENLDNRVIFNIENKSKEGNIIQEIQKDKKEFFEDVIKEINDLIESRGFLNKNIIYKIDKELCRFNTKNSDLATWNEFDNRLIERGKLEIEKFITNLEKEKRFEEVSCFRDISLFKKDLRFFRQELGKVIQKERILSHS